jgi:hypothetical protein
MTQGSPTGSPAGIGTLAFTPRKESWVAESQGRFYKIIRRGSEPQEDLVDPACMEIARREYTNMQFLHALDDRVCAPIGIHQACIVYPLLSGPDMRALLLRNPPREQVDACLRGVIALLASLHRAGAGSADYPFKDYRRDSFLAPGREVLDRMEARRRTVVITGFEARNFRFDEKKGIWCFFDPHHLWRGLPEEDLARFVISLLMLRGRRAGPRTWTNFDRFALLSTYEELAPDRLDRTLLNYFLREQLAKRRFHAMKAVASLSALGRLFKGAYTWLYYRRLRHAVALQGF